METALSIEALNAYYGKAHIVQGVTLDIARGQIVAIVGRNGVGKTTLLRAIVGLVETKARTITLSGINIMNEPTYRRARAGIAFMPQDLRYIPGLTVNEMFELAVSSVRSRASVAKVLKHIPEIEPLLQQRAETLSGGQKQLVAFARSLLVEPSVLLLDEPTEGLMPSLVKRVAELLRIAVASGIAVLLVEQNIPLVYGVATSIHVMHRGRFVAAGTAETLSDAGVIERYLGLSGV